jgi:hypothetical protein
MRARADALLLLVLIVGLTMFPSAALASPPSPTAPIRQGLTIVTMRLGISAGDAIQKVERGADRRTLQWIVPELFEAATALGVRIDTVSVGRGFWSDDGAVESENDLDLVVTGLRENVLALGATMGQRWNQGSVLVWESMVEGDMLTVTMPLLSSPAALSEAQFEALAGVLTDGGHIGYGANESLVFVAHTGDDSDDEFRARMGQAKTLLDASGVRTGSLEFAQAEMTELTRGNYQQFIDAAVRGKAA